MNDTDSLSIRIEPNLEAPSLLITSFPSNYIEQSLCADLYVVILVVQLD